MTDVRSDDDGSGSSRADRAQSSAADPSRQTNGPAVHSAAEGASRQVTGIVNGGKEVVRSMVLLILAVICLIAGAVSIPSPFPIGALLLVAGLSLLLMASARARRNFSGLRQRWPFLDGGVKRVAPWLPHSLRQVLTPVSGD